jgi:hypothetical protein
VGPGRRSRSSSPDDWIERYRRQAEKRYQRLDRVPAAMDETDDEEQS